MIQKINSHYAEVFTAPIGHYRYIILLGGRGAGRSKVAAQRATAKIFAPEYYRAAIMRLVLGDIRNSIFADIRDNMEENEVDELCAIRHDLSFRVGKNSIRGIGFKKSSGDQKSKLKSLANFNEVIIEEADEISEEDFIMLDDSLRTLKSPVSVMMMLNPPDKNHWIIKRWFNLVPSGIEGFYKLQLKEEYKDQVLFIDTNYEVNARNIAASTKHNWEQYEKTNPDHYYNMIRGLVSEGARGRIFKNWLPMPDAEFDLLPYPSIYGLDFGYTNDPTALIEIKQHNNDVWLREIIYRTGLINRDPENKVPSITNEMEINKVPKDARIYADSAEPKSIAEIGLDGYNILPSTKGKDSINVGIDLLLGKTVHYTEGSTNIAYESQNYLWALDKDKEPTNKPIDKYNHGMDATRYGVYTDSLQSYIGF